MTNPLVKIVSSAHTAIGKYHFSLRRTKASWRNGRFQSPDKAWTTSVWRTLSHERARRPSLTTRPESTLGHIIWILTPVSPGKRTVSPQYHSLKVPREKVSVSFLEVDFWGCQGAVSWPRVGRTWHASSCLHELYIMNTAPSQGI